MILCPVCKKVLIKQENSYCCLNHHNFDIAKQGYTNLYLKSSKNSGDNKAMVDARTAFLNLHFYDPLLHKILEMIKDKPCEYIIDAGCGEGYYTNLIEQATHAEVFAFDLSKDALKYAARQNKRIHYFLSSIFAIPMEDACADLLLNIFAPLANDEYYRLIKEGGYLIKVDPHHLHLKEMKDVLYEVAYENEVLDLDVQGFTLDHFEEVTFKMHLNKEAIAALFKMTPYYYKTDKQKSAQLLAMDELDCTASFMIYLYKK